MDFQTSLDGSVSFAVVAAQISRPRAAPRKTGQAQLCRSSDINAQTMSAYFMETVNCLYEADNVENPQAEILPVNKKVASFDVFSSLRRPKHGWRFL